MKTLFFIFLISGFFMRPIETPGRLNYSGAATLPYLIDVEKGLKNVVSVPLSTLGSQIEYVALETNHDCLIQQVSKTIVTDSYIYVSDGTRLLLFDRKGKYLKQIGATGRGPGEYARIADYIVDTDGSEIFVLASRMVLVYDLNGLHKRDFTLDFASNQFILRDKNSLIFHPFNLAAPSTEPVYSWYITDRNGKVQQKLINTLKRENKGFSIPTSPLYLFNGTPHLMEFGVDTLYEYINMVKNPYTIFNSGKLKMKPDPTMAEVPQLEGTLFVNDVIETSENLFIKVFWIMADSTNNCVYDKIGLKLSTLKGNGFINDIDGGMPFWPEEIIDDNILIDYVDAFDFIKYLKSNPPSNAKVKDSKKTDLLNAFVKPLTESSNPIIIILKR